jgi:hypothetical protein
LKRGRRGGVKSRGRGGEITETEKEEVGFVKVMLLGSKTMGRQKRLQRLRRSPRLPRSGTVTSAGNYGSC